MTNDFLSTPFRSSIEATVCKQSLDPQHIGSMSHNIGNAIQVSMSRATLWKINWAAAYGKLSIILLIKTGNNIFLAIFSYNYWNTYNANIFTLISGVYLAVEEGTDEPLHGTRKCKYNHFHRSCVTDLLTPLGTRNQDVHDVLITQTKQCRHFTAQNAKPMSQEKGMKREPWQETRASYNTVVILTDTGSIFC